MEELKKEIHMIPHSDWDLAGHRVKSILFQIVDEIAALSVQIQSLQYSVELMERRGRACR